MSLIVRLTLAFASLASINASPIKSKSVNTVINGLSISDLQADLAILSNFHTRFYNSTTGAAASQWLLGYVGGITSGRDDITAKAFTHAAFPQTSAIVHFNGQNSSAPVTIVGSHIDSVSSPRGELEDPASNRSPGADDDGSGSVNVIAALRALVEAGFEPATPLEFHWYAGEEGGLLGSDAVSKKYKADGIEVNAYMNLDMNAYTKPGEEEVIVIRQDFSDPDLNKFIESLINEYIGLPIATAQCGYACSDHASWHRQGFPAAMPFEGRTRNPLFHTIEDTTDAPGFSWEHSIQFAKLAVAFAYELSA
ncbi:aminopeptidase [Pleurotus eryngii]|uniref:Peptide hydrolase n=1 Tax=Pleurotus eryngii TaxID=5323 RepID=A0A9P5ZZ84_PLEER|nr:aminopeptidase [Pleurotus eryngii]